MILECSHLDVGYGKLAVARDISLSVDSGEMVALVGPNGSGKTTLLLTIAGLLRPLRGTVKVQDQYVNGHPDKVARRGFILVPDDRCLFPQLTTRQNLRLAQRRNGPGLEVILEHFPALRNRMNVRAGLLSGGEQQMLALGRAIVREPKVLLVDEMSMGLAPTIVELLFPVLRGMADRGTAVLIVEQHVELALRAADRGYVLQHGKVVLQGPAAQLRSSRELLEASYLGDDIQLNGASGEGP